MKKRIISIVLVLALFATFACVSASAASYQHWYGNDFCKAELYRSGNTVSAYTMTTSNNGTAIHVDGAATERRSNGETAFPAFSNTTYSTSASASVTLSSGATFVRAHSNHSATKYGFTYYLEI